jgi:hypothetical protein
MLDLGTTASAAEDEEAQVTSLGTAAGVELRPVVGSVSALILGVPGPDEFDSDAGEPVVIADPTVDVPWTTLRRVSVPRAAIAVPIGGGVIVALVTGQASLGLLVCVTGWIGSASWRVPFSFGEGFVGYRPDPRWPAGVQEDDDFRWDWGVHRAPSDDDEMEFEPAR